MADGLRDRPTNSVDVGSPASRSREAPSSPGLSPSLAREHPCDQALDPALARPPHRPVVNKVGRQHWYFTQYDETVHGAAQRRPTSVLRTVVKSRTQAASLSGRVPTRPGA